METGFSFNKSQYLLTVNFKFDFLGVLKTNKNRVMFYARLSSTKTLHFHSTIKFDVVVTNEGGHYNPGDGVFVAPVSGAYLFSWTALTYSGHYEFTELRVENVVKASVASSAAGNQYTPGTTTLVCHVDKGHHVWVETSGGTSANYLYDWGGDTTSFMGLLVYDDDE